MSDTKPAPLIVCYYDEKRIYGLTGKFTEPRAVSDLSDSIEELKEIVAEDYGHLSEHLLYT
ncbi:hypothetical protein H4218_006430, partial [Coemansia sp. IMI 209128]